MSLFGQRLREVRKARGQKQEQMADAVGVSREQWGRYERGLAVPGADVLARAAQAGIDIRYVITGSRDYEPAPTLSADEQVLLQQWRAATREVRNAALGALVGGASGAAAQVFHGQVGQVVRGDAHGTAIDLRSPAPRKR
ncbi:helix-turn-helix transcriptional regulator [Rubrivivax sp.]